MGARLFTACAVLALVACTNPEEGVVQVKSVRIDITGMSFEVDTAGEIGAEPVLLLHGFPQNSRKFLPETRSLCAFIGSNATIRFTSPGSLTKVS